MVNLNWKWFRIAKIIYILISYIIYQFIHFLLLLYYFTIINFSFLLLNCKSHKTITKLQFGFLIQDNIFAMCEDKHDRPKTIHAIYWFENTNLCGIYVAWWLASPKQYVSYLQTRFRDLSCQWTKNIKVQNYYSKLFVSW